MTPTMIAAHTLTSLDREGLDGLDPQTYSLMKHGHRPSIETLAGELVTVLVETHPEVLDPQVRVTLPVAYRAVLPACGYLVRVMVARLKELRGGSTTAVAPVRMMRIAKSAVTSIDYAASSLEERRAQLESMTFRLDGPIDGDLVILVDDLRMTGLAEEAGIRAILAGDPGQLITAYVAAAAPELATDPTAEKRLNHAYVSHPGQLLDCMRSGEFDLTIRYLKWLLTHPEVEMLLPQVPMSVRVELREGAQASGLWEQPEYSRAKKILDQDLIGQASA